MPIQPNPNLSPEELLASALEAEFAEYRRSLTDESTAETMRITLRVVRRLLAGAQEQGLEGEEAYRALDDMIVSMMGAPGLLTGTAT